MTTPRIDFVFFDLGDVLIHFDPSAAMQNLSEIAQCSPQRCDEVVYQSGLQKRYESGQVTSADFVAELRERFAITDTRSTDDAILTAVSAMFTPIDRMRELIESVRQTRCGTGLLSNTCPAHWQWISKQNYPALQARFDATVLSYSVGSMKPYAKIYAAAEQAAGVPPERILFLDDKIENVNAANARRWNGIHFRSAAQAAAEIASYNFDRN